MGKFIERKEVQKTSAEMKSYDNIGYINSSCSWFLYLSANARGKTVD